MNKLRYVLVVIFMLMPAVVHALTAMNDLRYAHAQKFRFVGNIDLTYRKYTEERGAVTSEQSAFHQRYGLGMFGYVWKPRLMIFSSGISFVLSNLKHDATETNTRDINFNVNSTMFPLTPYPLLVNIGRTTSYFEGDLSDNSTLTSTFFNMRWLYPVRRNISMIVDYGHSLSEVTGGPDTSSVMTDGFSVIFRGSAAQQRRGLNLNIGANQNNNGGNNSGNEGVRKKGFSPNLGLRTWEINYQFQRLRTEDERFGQQESTNHRLGLSGTRNIWIFSGYGDVVFYKSGDSKSLSLALSLERNTSRFFMTHGYAFSYLDSILDTSTSHHFFSQNTYNYTPNLSFNGGISYHRDTSESQGIRNTSVKSRSNVSSYYNLNLGSTYFRNFTNYYMLAYISGTFGGGQSGDSGTSSNSYGLGYGLRLESMPKIYRFFSYRYTGQYTGNYDSDGNRSDSMTLEASASRSFGRIFLSGNASMGYNISSPKNGTSFKGLSASLNLGSSIRLTSRASVNLAAGYSMNRADNVTGRTLILSESLSYAVYKNIDVSISASQSESSSDGGNPSKYYDVFTTVNYRLRKIFVTGEYNISTQEENGADKINKKTIFMRLSRPFG